MFEFIFDDLRLKLFPIDYSNNINLDKVVKYYFYGMLR